VLSEFNGKTWSVVRLGLGHVNAMLKARDGTIWIASNTGLHRFADRSWVSNGSARRLAQPASACRLAGSTGR